MYTPRTSGMNYSSPLLHFNWRMNQSCSLAIHVRLLPFPPPFFSPGDVEALVEFLDDLAHSNLVQSLW